MFLAAILWGSCFAFQKMGMDYIGAYTLGTFRFIIGALVLLPVIRIFAIADKRRQVQTRNAGFGDWELYLGGGICGVALFAAASLQQIGIQYTTAGKAGFLTSMTIVFVAAISIVKNKELQIFVIAGVVMALIGMYLLCMSGGFILEKGDAYELAAVGFWALQLFAIDKYSKTVDVLKLSFVQFMTTGILSAIAMGLFEHPTWMGIHRAAVPILYTAIIEVAVAYTLQIIGQKYTPPVIASIILSFEAVFSVICGALLLGETMSIREKLGCICMFVAILIAQISSRQKEENPVGNQE